MSTTADDTVSYVTPVCFHCGKDGIVQLTPAEYYAVTSGTQLIQNALPDRDAGFREQVRHGTHPACWDEMFEGLEE